MKQHKGMMTSLSNTAETMYPRSYYGFEDSQSNTCVVLLDRDEILEKAVAIFASVDTREQYMSQLPPTSGTIPVVSKYTKMNSTPGLVFTAHRHACNSSDISLV